MSQIPPPLPPAYQPQTFSPPVSAPAGYANQSWRVAPGPIIQPPLTRMSGAAVASLICGIFGLVPLLPGIAAVVFSLIGIHHTAKPNVRGRGMAVAGLTLGSLSLILWGSISVCFVMSYLFTRPERAVAHQFFTDLQKDNYRAMSLECSNTLSPSELDEYVQAVRSWGKVEDVYIFSADHKLVDGTMRADTDGELTFTNGNRCQFHLGMLQQNSTWRIDAVAINGWSPPPPRHHIQQIPRFDPGMS